MLMTRGALEKGVDAAQLSIAVVIASVGRPDMLAAMVERMARQTRQPELLLFSVVSGADLPADFRPSVHLQAITGPKGLPAQRNSALNHLGGAYDLVIFYDDDFVPSRFSMERIERFFRDHPDVIGATGRVIADGINNAGISSEEADRLVADYDANHVDTNCIIMSLHGLYGCNMVFRASAIGDVRFDERLKLYGWQEDIDFTGALKHRGRMVKTLAFAGVHQGVKHGRTPGVRLGYSQIVNPIYLARKGTMRRGYALKIALSNMAANHARLLRPEPWVDRIGRVRGNWLGLFDIARGRFTPERIEHL